MELASQLNNLRGRLSTEEDARREAERVVAAVEERVRQTECAVKGLQGHKTEAFKTLELELERERRKREELEQSKEKVGEVLLSVLDMNQHLVDTYSASSTSTKKKKKVKKAKTRSASTLTAAAGGASHTALRAHARELLSGGRSTVGSGTLQRSTASSKARKTATATANSVRASSASSLLQLPFLPAPHRKTFNLLAALSEAVRQCRTREPKQVLDALYELILHDSDYVTHKTERQAFPPTPPRPASARCSRMRAPSQGEHILGEATTAQSPCSHTWSPPRGRTFRSPDKVSHISCLVSSVTQQQEVGESCS